MVHVSRPAACQHSPARWASPGLGLSISPAPLCSPGGDHVGGVTTPALTRAGVPTHYTKPCYTALPYTAAPCWLLLQAPARIRSNVSHRGRFLSIVGGNCSNKLKLHTTCFLLRKTRRRGRLSERKSGWIETFCTAHASRRSRGEEEHEGEPSGREECRKAEVEVISGSLGTTYRTTFGCPPHPVVSVTVSLPTTSCMESHLLSLTVSDISQFESSLPQDCSSSEV